MAFIWAKKVAPDMEAQAASESIGTAPSRAEHDMDVDKSLASIRSHRSNKDEDQDDTPFSVGDWLPSWIDVLSDGYSLFNLYLQTITSLFFLAIAYSDGLSIVALILLYYVLILMFMLFIALANVKGRQFVYVQLLERKVTLDLTSINWMMNWITWLISTGLGVAVVLFIWSWFDKSGAILSGGTAAAFGAISSQAMVVLKYKGYLEQEKTLVPLNYILQDDPEGANLAPGRKAWVNELVIVKEEDFRRYLISRHIKYTIDPASCREMPHGRDKWDLMAAEILIDPELKRWPAMTVEDVKRSPVWATWTPKQRRDFEHTLDWRYGWAFYFGTVQFDRHEWRKPWVIATIGATVAFTAGAIIYGAFSGAKRGNLAS